MNIKLTACRRKTHYGRFCFRHVFFSSTSVSTKYGVNFRRMVTFVSAEYHVQFYGNWIPCLTHVDDFAHIGVNKILCQ